VRLFTRLFLAIASAIIAIGLAVPAQAFQLQYFDTYPSLLGCTNTGESGLDSGIWYGYQCRRTSPTAVQLWVSYSP